MQATVVTANGSILTANKDENPDLFWAIRGGGGNFGVIVEFVFQLYDQRKTVYSGALIYSQPLFKPVLQVIKTWWDHVLKDSPTKESMMIALTRDPHGPEYQVSCFFVIPIAFLSLFLASYNCNPILQWVRSRRKGSV